MLVMQDMFNSESDADFRHSAPSGFQPASGHSTDAKARIVLDCHDSKQPYAYHERHWQ